MAYSQYLCVVVAIRDSYLFFHPEITCEVPTTYLKGAHITVNANDDLLAVFIGQGKWLAHWPLMRVIGSS